MHARDMTVIVMTGRVRHAVKAEQAGADIVVAQGTEAGGHTGEIGALALIPQVVDAVSIPVLAAGGIADGRGIIAALALGAQGVVVGTRFIATPEAQATRSYRDAIVRSAEADTVRTRCYTGKPARTIRNSYNEAWERKIDQIQPFPLQVMTSVQEGVMDYAGAGGGEGNPDRDFMPAGQGMGLIRAIKPAAEVFTDLVREAEAILTKGVFAGSGSH
jgi:enoyl-[acyl-carrier protein] reductase II